MGGAGQRNVVDVVPGRRRIGAELAPARHAPVNQARIVGHEHVRAETEPLHDARTKSLDQTVGRANQITDDRYALGRFQVDCDCAA